MRPTGRALRSSWDFSCAAVEELLVDRRGCWGQHPDRMQHLSGVRGLCRAGPGEPGPLRRVDAVFRDRRERWVLGRE